MPTIYTIFTGDELPETAFRSKEQAIRAATAVFSGEPIDIEKIETPPLTLDLVLNLINSSGGKYAASREVVHTVKRGRKKALANAV